MSKPNLGNVLGGLALGIIGIAVLNEIATNPRINPLWRRIAQTAEGDVYQHFISGAIVTLL